MDKKSMNAYLLSIGITGSPVPPGLRGTDPRITIIDDLVYSQGTITNRVTNSYPEIQYIDYNPITNQVEIEEVSQETFFNVDYSEIENRVMSEYPDIIIDSQIMELKTINRKSVPNEIQQKVYANMFDMSLDFTDFDIFGPIQSFPVPAQKWVRDRTKYHEPRSQFLAKAKRKRKINKANRKRARL